MQSILKRRPSSPMVVAFIALFLAVSGTATAAKLITGKNIARNTITGKHVKDRSLSAADFRGSLAGAPGPAGPEGARGLTGAKGERGPQGDRGETGAKSEVAGPKGDKGEKGDTGDRGPAGFNGITRVEQGFSVPQGSQGINGSVACAAGQRVVGGGFKVAEPLAPWTVTLSTYPDTTSSWTVRLGNTGASFTLPATVYALCVSG